MTQSVPIIPNTFVAGDVALGDFQALANCARFLSSCDNWPAWHLYRTTTVALASGVNVVAFPTVAFDSDSIEDGTGVTINTQGYYLTEAVIPESPGTTSLSVNVYFQFIGGANNPYHNGVTLTYGARGGLGTITAAVDTSFSARAQCPYVCYPGDKLRVVANASGTGATVNNNNNANAFAGRYPPTFTGHMFAVGC